MERFVVISYDDDQQQVFWDIVEAETEDQAKGMVGEARDYAIPVDAVNAEALVEISKNLKGFSFPSEGSSFFPGTSIEREEDK